MVTVFRPLNSGQFPTLAESQPGETEAAEQQGGWLWNLHLVIRKTRHQPVIRKTAPEVVGAAEQTIRIAVAGLEEGAAGLRDTRMDVEQQIAIGGIVGERCANELQGRWCRAAERVDPEEGVVSAQVIGKVAGIEAVDSLARGR